MKRSSKIFMAILCGLSLILNLVIISPRADTTTAELPSGATYINSIDIQTTTNENTAWINNQTDTVERYYQYIINNYYNFTETNPLIISTNKELVALAKAVNKGKNFEGQFVELIDDIDLNGTQPTLQFDTPDVDGKVNLTISGTLNNVWRPIGATKNNCFKGTFDGGGHKILNMIVNEKKNYAGLFGYVDKGTIKNVGIEGNSVVISSATANSASAGGIAGKIGNSATISNCYNTGTVASTSTSTYIAYAGGITGEVYDSTISSSYNNGAIFSFSADYRAGVGGIAGDVVRSTINNSYNTGSVSSSAATDAFAGGIGGKGVQGPISNSYNDGTVSSYSTNGYAFSGGIVGSIGSQASKIINSYNTGSVSSSAAVEAYSGGIAGEASIGLIDSNYNTGEISSTSTSTSTSDSVYAGGIVGNASGEYSPIFHSYNTGSVSSSATAAADACAGGIAGYIHLNTVQFCYSAAEEVTAESTGGTAYKAALVGKNNGGVVVNSYYDNKVSGVTEAVSGSADDGGVGGLTTDKMQGTDASDTENMYAFKDEQVDGEYIWRFVEDDYPQLNILTGRVKVSDVVKSYNAEGVISTLAVNTEITDSELPQNSLRYQWYKSGTIIYGANTSTYALTADDISKGGTFSCTISTHPYEGKLTMDILVKGLSTIAINNSEFTEGDIKLSHTSDDLKDKFGITSTSGAKFTFSYKAEGDTEFKPFSGIGDLPAGKYTLKIIQQENETHSQGEREIPFTIKAKTGAVANQEDPKEDVSTKGSVTTGDSINFMMILGLGILLVLSSIVLIKLKTKNRED